MAGGTYRPNSRGLRQLVASREMGSAMRSLAREVGVPAFQAAAPRRTGEFAARVGVEAHTGSGGRAGAAVVASPDHDRDPNAPVPIEFGTSDTAAAHALQAVVDALDGGRR